MPQNKTRSPRKKLMQWLIVDCKCDPKMADQISKRFVKYYSKIVQGTHFPMDSEVQAKNIVLAFTAGYIQGMNDNE